jgi:hypothetical protein
MKSVELPLDHLAELWPAKLRGARLGALLHPASVSADLTHASGILERWSGEFFELSAFFGPQHGFLGQTQDNMVEWKSYPHPRLGLPVHSLYGETREPTPEMLAGLDVLLIDLQDTGARYYTFIWTMFRCLRACAKAGLPVLVLDRPNPLNGLTTEGPVLDPGYRSFVGLHPLPVRHGLTIGELAGRFRAEAFPTVDLTVLPMRNWERAMWFDQTGLPWVMPSPNMPTLASATVYPGICLLEGTNISVGRGTTRPFEIFGAPFLEAKPFARELNALRSRRLLSPLTRSGGTDARSSCALICGSESRRLPDVCVATALWPPSRKPRSLHNSSRSRNLLRNLSPLPRVRSALLGRIAFRKIAATRNAASCHSRLTTPVMNPPKPDAIWRNRARQALERIFEHSGQNAPQP